MLKKGIKNIMGTNKKQKEKSLTLLKKKENLVAEIMPVYQRLTKENITEIKHNGYNEIADLVQKQKNAKYISFILENLGLLPEDFNGNFLYELLNHNNENVRYLTVKNIGKLKDEKLITILAEFFQKESNTTIKREIMSSIGRQSNPKAKSFLFHVLENNDPKIVYQAD